MARWTQTVEANAVGRDFVVGDLHGHMAMLNALLAAVEFDATKDRLFSVGDLIDRGPHSEALLRRFIREPSFHAVRGNHEAMLSESMRTSFGFRIWQFNGGAWAAGMSREDRAALAALVEQLPLTISLRLADGRTAGLIHAELPPGCSWDEVAATELHDDDLLADECETLAASALWGRRRYTALCARMGNPKGKSTTKERLAEIEHLLTPTPGVDLVIAGHSILPTRRPVLNHNTLFIDTGAYQRRGRLTLVEPLTSLYWQSQGHRKATIVRGGPKKIEA
jgi:serine/threonine protein phosphatase 1